MRETYRGTWRTIHTWWEKALDVVYPPVCVACRAPGAWWCAPCRTAVHLVPHYPCGRCLRTERGHSASACEGALPFSGVVTTGFYHSVPLRRLIAELKYQGVTVVATAVEQYLRDVRPSGAAPFPWSHHTEIQLIPMPLSAARERDRGFNQAEWIADRMRAAWAPQIPVRCALARRHMRAAQAQLGHDAALRAANIRSAFVALMPLHGSVILVDDVTTTGSTAAEAARVCFAAGAEKVYLATLAVGA
jgi:predicted amidophosphoribosyltransferase